MSKVRDNSNALDIATQDLSHLYELHNVSVPLLLSVPSFTISHFDPLAPSRALSSVKIQVLRQSRYPWLLEETLLPYPAKVDDGEGWYVSGSGDVLDALNRSGAIDRLLEQGKEYIFISDLYNPGAS
jgi:UTP--glucose-1-phosphate uridylyltransferase